MLRASKMARAQASASPLRILRAIGMRREFTPHWPVPLPAPMPRNANKHTLVLDIDETLIHTFGMIAHTETPEEAAIVKGVPLIEYHMLVRPYLKEFLAEVNELFEVIFWTAGVASYCAGVLDAIERHVLDLPPSTYNYMEMLKESPSAAPDGGAEGEAVASEGTGNVNFYALSRTQTLERQGYMKYLPMLGRPLSGVIMIDDNVRSFPLNPRNSIKIDAFDPDDGILQQYMYALQQAQKMDETASSGATMSSSLRAQLHAGAQEMARLESDRALLDLLPLLRALAAVPAGKDITRELDYWRDVDYVKCDDFKETMNPRSTVRQQTLGAVLASRASEPIPPLRMHVMNNGFVASAKGEVEDHARKVLRSRL